MNLGGTPSINLSEAARLLKQSNVGINSVQNQQVTSPMMFMHQAVAMQQFQFQQALLMQQVMATQQAAARAASVKSAQEMAATRAAEISKLLKGIESNVDEKKKSPRRFICQTSLHSRSRSRSHSCSRSFSKSKSRSPFRYHRNRSTSRSPIRRRHDSRPFPISRDYFRYRGRSRQSYYRGCGEYSWDSSYRQDWERERDHYSLYLHRRRSRSRSQVSRKSCTPSHSPYYKRERSSTPLRFRHKEERSQCSSQHLRSLEKKLIPSCSQSLSYSHSRSRSHSESLHHEYGSQSPIQMLRDKKNGENHYKTEKLNLILGDGKCTSTKNPSTNGIKEDFYPTTIINENEDTIEHWNFRSKNITKQSISPERSLSISLSPPKKRKSGKLKKELKSNEWKKAMVRSVLFQRIDEIVAIDEPPQNSMATFVNIEDRIGNSNALEEEQIDIESNVKSKEDDFEVLNKQHARKEFDKEKKTFDKNDVDDKEVDDLQDEMKSKELKNIKYKDYIKEEMDKTKVQDKNLDISIVEHNDVKDHLMTLLEHLDMETREEKVDSSIDFEYEDNTLANNISKNSTPNNDSIIAKPSSSNETLIYGSCIKEEILNIVPNGNRNGHEEIGREIGDATNEKNTMSDDAIDREGDLDLIFEGPMLPPNLEVEINEDFKENNYVIKSCCENIIETTRPKKLSIVVVEEEVVIFMEKHKSKSKEAEDVYIGLQKSKSKPMLKDDSCLHEKCKFKEKSQLKERSKNKRYNDKIDKEKQKEKHHKHQKRHRKNEEIEKEENNNDENKDVDFFKSREEHHCHCNKKHGRRQSHKEDKHRKRRHKHKHRGKLTLEPLDMESLVVEIEGKGMD